MTFTDMLRDAERQHDSMLCVGLDPDPAKFPAPYRGDSGKIGDFCCAIVDATADLVIAFKPQIAYFAAQSKPQQPDLLPHVSLTERESEVLLRVAKGFTLPEIGVQLGLSRHTIADYVKQIYRKLNVSSRAEAALEAQRLGLFGR